MELKRTPLLSITPLLFLLLASVHPLTKILGSAAADCPNLVINNEWEGGLDCDLSFVVDHEAHGWEIILTFDSPLTSLECWQEGLSLFIFIFSFSSKWRMDIEYSHSDYSKLKITIK